MEQVKQHQPGHAVVSDNCHQIVDRGDQRAGGNRRIYLDFMEKQRDDRSGKAGDGHSQYQGNAHAGGNCEAVKDGIAFKQPHIDADTEEGDNS